MRTIRLILPARTPTRSIAHHLETAIKAAGLRVALKGSLGRYPGCTHWHVKRGAEAGTLEMTFIPSERRAWLAVRGDRDAGWIAGAARQIARHVRQA